MFGKNVSRCFMTGKTEPLPQVYLLAVNTIKKAILDSQYKSIRLVAAEQLSLYYSIGQYISRNSRKGSWGTNAIAQISARLKRELPGLRGFSETNMRLMRLFYETWEDISSGQPEACQFAAEESSATADEIHKTAEEMSEKMRKALPDVNELKKLL